MMKSYKLSYKFFICISFAFFGFLLGVGQKSSLCFENNIVPINIKVNEVQNSINNVYTCNVQPDSNNPEEKQEPFNVDVIFNNVKSNSNDIAEATAYIDFNKIAYNKAGLYKYFITQIASENPMALPISDEKFEIYVQVFQKDEKFEPYVLNQVGNINNETKDDQVNFNNIVKTTYLSIKNYNRGKIPNKDEYFKYKIWLDGNIGDSFNIYGQDEYVYYDGQTIKTVNRYEITEDSSYVYIYLKDEQVATIGISSEGEDGTSQILLGTKYRITQLNSRKVKTTMNDEICKEYEGIANEDNVYIEIINEKNFDVAITGIFVNIYPFILLIVVVGILIYVIKAKRLEI